MDLPQQEIDPEIRKARKTQSDLKNPFCVFCAFVLFVNFMSEHVHGHSAYLCETTAIPQ